MTLKRNIMTGVALAICGGCVSLDEPISSDFGKAYHANMAAQIVDPEAAEGAPTMDGQRTDAAIERYRTDTIKEPEEAKGVEFGNSGGD